MNWILPGLLFIFLIRSRSATISGMSKTAYKNPYSAEGRTTFPNARKKSGVYIIKEGGKIVYVGYSSNDLYRTMYRHFQKWNHPQQKVVTYKDRPKQYQVRVVFTTPAQADRLETALIKKHRPRDNEIKYESIMQNQDKVMQTYKRSPIVEEMPF